MMIGKKKEVGFSIVEAVIAVAAIGVIGLTGWFVYQHNRTKPGFAAAGAQTTNQGQQQATTQTPATTVVKVPELGIQITVPDDLKDLTYQIQTNKLQNGSTATTAYFSTTSLTAIDNNCAGVNTPLGTLGRVDGQYPSDDPTAALDYGTLIKQFPTFYISEGVPNGSCSTNQNALAAVSKDKGDFQTAVSSVAAAN